MSCRKDYLSNNKQLRRRRRKIILPCAKNFMAITAD